MKTNPRRSDRDGGEAFLPDPRRSGTTVQRDSLAEMMASEYLAAATSAEEQTEDTRDQVTLDELGGPFLEVSGRGEFAMHEGADATVDGEGRDEREAFPTAMRSS